MVLTLAADCGTNTNRAVAVTDSDVHTTRTVGEHLWSTLVSAAETAVGGNTDCAHAACLWMALVGTDCVHPLCL